jgi:hypothetical protein
MFEELRTYLLTITTPENTEILITACNSLEEIGILNHSFDLEQIMHSANEYSSEDNFTAIYELIQEYLITTLLQFGLEVKPNSNVEILNSILEAFILMPEYGDPVALLQILEQELQPEELFSEVIAYVTNTTWQLYSEIITSCNPALVTRLNTVLSENVAIEEPVDISSEREWFIAIRRDYNPTIASLAIQNGFKLKSPLERLMAYSREFLIEFEANPEGLACECLGILALSNIPLAEYSATITELLEHYAKDINVLTKANLFFNKLLAEAISNAKT